MPGKQKKSEQKFHEEDFEEVKAEKVEEKEESIIIEDDDDESEALTVVERFMDYEVQTKIGLVATLLFLLGLIFSWYWFNANWWIVLIVGAAGVKTLYTQMHDLKEEKPAEAKIAKYSFYAMVTLLVLRDLWITYRLDELLEQINKLKDYIR